jgi:hypothetical protein
MTRKRDGPAPLTATPGQGVRRTRASSAPPEIPAQVRAQPPHTTRSQRRQDRSWRGFAHALYALLLRLAARRFGLEVGNVHEIHEERLP